MRRYGIIKSMIGANSTTLQTTLRGPDSLHQQCQAAQARHHFFSEPTPGLDHPQPVVVAVSGGIDSVALLHVLYHLTAEWQLTLHVAHLDHNLRPESAADARFVAQLAEHLQLPFHQRQLSPTALAYSGAGIEAAAREARYRFLAEVALAVTSAEQTPIIALAHHADDQAETLLLHLVRGSGLQGLGGMRWVSIRRAGDLWSAAPIERCEQPIRLIRPFLSVQRAEVLRYVRTHNLTWREDSSNTDQRFARNRLRHTVLPALATLNPQVVQTLTRTADLLQQEADRLAMLDREALVALLIEPAWSLAQLTAWQAQSRGQQQATAPQRAVLDGERLIQLPTATQRAILREAYMLVTTAATAPDFAHSESLLTALQPPHNASGPHTWLADVAWSVAGATAAIPTRLSLHRVGALPFTPDHPFLDEAWRAVNGCWPLPAPSAVPVGGWTLTVAALPSASLPADWRAQGHGWQTFLDAEQVGMPVLTTPQPGYKFAPLGMKGRHKSVGDFLTDRKVPVTLRSGWPLIVDQAKNEVLWIGGYQPSHCARITEQTQVVLQLTWQKN